jgi:hypothetical protein
MEEGSIIVGKRREKRKKGREGYRIRDMKYGRI